MSPVAPAARPWLAVVLLLAATLCFAAMDNAVRHAGRLMPVLLVLWLRYCTQATLMGAWLLRQGAAGFRSAHPRFQGVRGVLLLGTSAFSFWGVQLMPVAEFTAIHMLTPVLTTLLAAWLLKEPVNALRWALVLGAFAGALIVMRPGSGLFGWVALLPLCGAVCYASFQVLTSKLAALEHPLTTQFYTGLIGTALLSLVLFAGPLDVTALLLGAGPTTWAWLIGIGLLGTLGHLLFILAFGRAPASRLVPFMYVQIAEAAAIGWLLFGDLPDRWGWVGMGVIAVCGGATAWLNTRSRRGPVSALSDDPAGD